VNLSGVFVSDSAFYCVGDELVGPRSVEQERAIAVEQTTSLTLCLS
jgi:hypothetical protein